MRVTYRLREDTKHKNKQGIKHYVLLRQESENLDPEKMEEPDPKKWSRFIVADNIKSCTIEYVAAIRMQEKEEDGSTGSPRKEEQPQKGDQKPPAQKEAKQPKETYELKTFKEWQERKPPSEKDAAAGKKAEQKPQEPFIPQALKINIVFYDPAGKKTIPFSFTIPVYTEHVYAPIKQQSTTAKLTDIIKKLSENVITPAPPTKLAQRPVIARPGGRHG